jgi:ribosomal-protein-alanine N-acetyltransferase
MISENTNTIFINEKLKLQILTKENISNKYIDWLNDSEITRYTGLRNIVNDRKMVEDYIDLSLNSKNEYLYGVYHQGYHVGNVKIGPIIWNDRSSDISYFLGEKNLWGNGIITNVITSLCSFCRDTLGIEKLNAGVMDKNIGSIKILEKCGFLKEGTRIKNYLVGNERVDQILYGKVL